MTVSIPLVISFELDPLFEHHFFSALDYFFAKNMAAAFDESNPMVLASCALVSRALSEGHICFDMRSMAGTARPISESGNLLLKYPDADAWVGELKKSSLVSDNIHTPLVLDADLRLYLSRYFDFQNRLVENIAARVKSASPSADDELMDKLLEQFIPGRDDPILTQKRAIKNAVLKPFTIISGGPGTGKTFVTGVIKKTISAWAKENGLPDQNILCVAPTGKAASKMEQGRTIHSALKPRAHHPGFYHHKKNPLHQDAVIIDEASMIDLPLLVRLLEAIPDHARVIMTGDKDQLASVQAGAVFSDLCAVRELSSHLFLLDHNFRSRGKTGIEKLSKAINEKDIQSLEELLISDRYPDVVFENTATRKSVTGILERHMAEEFNSFKDAESVSQALLRLDGARILCAHNSGEYGTLQINHLCEKLLRSSNNSGIEEKPFFRIVMINVNDYKKGLFNGDTGIVVEKNRETTAFFKGLDNTVKSYRYSDLPSHGTAFAITIHKSQGAEFDSVLIIVPDRFSPVLNRQLLYTGVTRAKKKVIIVGNLEIIKTAIGLDVKRHSGIAQSLSKKLRKKIS